MVTGTANSVVSPQNIAQYHEQGYMILPGVIPQELLQLLRDQCQFFIDLMNAEMDRLGTDQIGINHRNSRYFISLEYRKSKPMAQFIFSPFMAQVVQAVLGPNAVLFWEQWVIKFPEKGKTFAWHQDSGYVGFPHPPYLTCWCTLDDVDEANGTVYVLPHDRGQTRGRILEHTLDPVNKDLVAYHGSDPGIPVIAPAGSIVAFTSYTLHRSGANTSKRMRRIYLPQYATAPVVAPNGKQKGLADPFLKDGQIIAQM